MATAVVRCGERLIRSTRRIGRAPAPVLSTVLSVEIFGQLQLVPPLSCAAVYAHNNVMSVPSSNSSTRHAPSPEVADQRTYEQRSFWAQNVFTSLVLGHGAAFLALIVGVMGADDPESVAGWIKWPAMFFGTGLSLSYLVAVLMWLARGGWDHQPTDRARFNKAALIAACLSAGIFAVGVASGLVSLWTLLPDSPAVIATPAPDTDRLRGAAAPEVLPPSMQALPKSDA